MLCSLNLVRVLSRWPLPCNMREHPFFKYEDVSPGSSPFGGSSLVPFLWYCPLLSYYQKSMATKFIAQTSSHRSTGALLGSCCPWIHHPVWAETPLLIDYFWLSPEHVMRMPVLAHFCSAWVTSHEDNLPTQQKLLQSGTTVSEPSANFLLCPYHKSQVSFLTNLLWLHCLSFTLRLLGIPSHAHLAPLNPTLCLPSTGSKLTFDPFLTLCPLYCHHHFTFHVLPYGWTGTLWWPGCLYLVHAISHGLERELSGSINCLPIVGGAPACTVDVYHLRHVTDGGGLDDVCHKGLVQHPDTCAQA